MSDQRAVIAAEWEQTLREALARAEAAKAIHDANPDDPWALNEVVKMLTGALDVVRTARCPDGDEPIRERWLRWTRIQISAFRERAELLRDAPTAFWRALDPERIQALAFREQLYIDGLCDLASRISDGTAREPVQPTVIGQPSA